MIYESDCFDYCCCEQASMTKDKNYIYNFSNVPVHIHVHTMLLSHSKHLFYINYSHELFILATFDLRVDA